jgi:GNAT superfamily N-acetyltransferase
VKATTQRLADCCDDLEIEPAEQGDFTAVRAALIVSYAEFQFTMPPAAFSAYLSDLLDLESRAGASALLVARRGGRVVGTVTYYPDGGRQRRGWPSGWASVRALAVVPQARGEGIASCLLAHCLDRARSEGAAALGLHTGELMKNALRLYGQLGFRRAPQFDLEMPREALDDPGPPTTAFAFVSSLVSPR